MNTPLTIPGTLRASATRTPEKDLTPDLSASATPEIFSQSWLLPYSWKGFLDTIPGILRASATHTPEKDHHGTISGTHQTQRSILVLLKKVSRHNSRYSARVRYTYSWKRSYRHNFSYSTHTRFLGTVSLYMKPVLKRVSRPIPGHPCKGYSRKRSSRPYNFNPVYAWRKISQERHMVHLMQ
jgi:hypothetical protein